MFLKLQYEKNTPKHIDYWDTNFTYLNIVGLFCHEILHIFLSHVLGAGWGGESGALQFQPS